MRIRRPEFIIFILTAALCLSAVGFTAGCAGGAGSGESPAGSGGNGGAPTEKITFMLDWTPNTNHTGLYVAQAKGYFEKRGLDVQIIECAQAGAETAVASGSADFGVSFQDSLVPAFSAEESARLPITAVAAIIQHNTSGIVSRKDAGVISPKYMTGRSYATWEMPIEQAILKKVVTDDGGDYGKINLIPSYVEDIGAAFASGIDSVWIYYAWDGIACEQKGIETDFFFFRDYADELDNYSPVIIANNDFLRNKPDAARDFLAALSEGYEFAIANPGEAAEIIVSAGEGLDPGICADSQKWLAKQYRADAAKWGVIDKDRWDAFYRWVYENGLCGYEIPSGFGFSNEYLP